MAVISNAVTIADAGAFSASLGALTLIKTITVSSAAGTVSFVDGTSSVVLDDTYPIYKFEFINIHPSNNTTHFSFQANVAGGSGFDETITSTYFRAFHGENGDDAGLGYDGNRDLAQATGFQELISGIGNDTNGNGNGELFLFNPSSTTFVTHFIATTATSYADEAARKMGVAGYFNTTAAIDEIQFKQSAGNIDSGIIKLYGIKDS